MPQPTAKLFATGGSQAVRLPAEFRFEGTTEIYIRRESVTGDVVLSRRPTSDWQVFMDQRAALADEEVLAGFMRDRQQPPAQQRTPFERDRTRKRS